MAQVLFHYKETVLLILEKVTTFRVVQPIFSRFASQNFFGGGASLELCPIDFIVFEGSSS